MYELSYSRSRSAYILLPDDVAWPLTDDAISMCIIHAESEDDAVRTARRIAAGQPLSLARSADEADLEPIMSPQDPGTGLAAP